MELKGDKTCWGLSFARSLRFLSFSHIVLLLTSSKMVRLIRCWGCQELIDLVIQPLSARGVEQSMYGRRAEPSNFFWCDIWYECIIMYIYMIPYKVFIKFILSYCAWENIVYRCWLTQYARYRLYSFLLLYHVYVWYFYSFTLAREGW